MGGKAFSPALPVFTTFYTEGKVLNFTAMLIRLSEGMIRSVLIFGLTLAISLPLGLLVSFGRMSKWAPFAFFSEAKNAFLRKTSGFKPIRFFTKIYISIMRGTPLMLQIMVVYFGPWYIFGIKISSAYQFFAVIIAFAINYAAYFAEIYRGGIESMPSGQYEAAEVLGYRKGQAFLKIILPQVVKRILPSVTNEVITLVKDTSLAFVIAYAEMFTVAKQIAAAESSVMPFVGAAMFYYAFNLLVALTMEKIEKSVAYYQ